MSRKPSLKEVDRSYHPKGYNMSPSLQRARKPFFLTNALIGGSVAAFTLGVYLYSISAVKQDDFSDVEDLLPPLEERSKIRSIEDEAKEIAGGAVNSIPAARGLPGAPSKAIPDAPLAQAAAASSFGWGPKKLSDVEWIKRRGWVDGNGNVLVWGAPNVDRIGRLSDSTSAKKLV
ncbi:mitochondrial protein [Cryptococcus wingfieldii CBS 7118]|uniref:Cytochrome c oxidase assembly factor 3 n=1 Tax=Cryptococcus wingfieldii CBS 7118 TaxID=1295528 RepID=A0A1E3IM61_9TREE|nr:mitochondrial protein [Cryptococcus wingfieldii CBS 7118]ODN89687.1 mitochondrial protein [Cryptococcus wingfieldii CBS 7118]